MAPKKPADPVPHNAAESDKETAYKP